jgi:hypothetical protein
MSRRILCCTNASNAAAEVNVGGEVEFGGVSLSLLVVSEGLKEDDGCCCCC